MRAFVWRSWGLTKESCDVHTDLTEWKMHTMGDVGEPLYKVQDTFSKPLLVFLIGEWEKDRWVVDFLLSIGWNPIKTSLFLLLPLNTFFLFALFRQESANKRTFGIFFQFCKLYPIIYFNYIIIFLTIKSFNLPLLQWHIFHYVSNRVSEFFNKVVGCFLWGGSEMIPIFRLFNPLFRKDESQSFFNW